MNRNTTTNTTTGVIVPVSYTLGEAAQVLVYSVTTIRRLVKRGLLKGYSLSGSPIVTRVTRESVHHYAGA